MQRVGVLAHLDKAEAVKASNKVIRTLKEGGIEVHLPQEAISSLSGVDGPLSEDLTRT